MQPLNKYTNIQLCDIIITNRYLNIFKDEAQKCMIELSLRRQNGDNFDYESYIEDNFKSLPDLNIDIKNINNSLQELKNMVNKK